MGTNDLSFSTNVNSTVTLGTTPTITVLSNTLTFPNPISGAHGLNMVGPGTLALNAANTYTGATSISNGTLALGAAGTLGGGKLTIQPGGVLDTTAYGAAGYNYTASVLTAGDTASFPIDINGSLNLTNTAASLNINGGTAAAGTLTVNGGLGLTGGTLNYLAGDQISLNWPAICRSPTPPTSFPPPR